MQNETKYLELFVKYLDNIIERKLKNEKDYLSFWENIFKPRIPTLKQNYFKINETILNKLFHSSFHSLSQVIMINFMQVK